MSQKTEKSWKDSNWYVSITGFWKEYRKHRMGIIGLAIIALYVGIAVGAPLIAPYDPSPSNKIAPSFLAPGWMQVFDPTGVQSGEFLPDTNITNPNENSVEVFGSDTYGAGSSFEAAHNSEENYMDLTWNHQAGDNPGFIIMPDSDMPDTENFIYFYQEFEWLFNGLPSDGNLTLELSVKLEGSFANESSGGLMFKIYVWFIDPSGNFRKVYDSSPPYREDWIQRRIGINYFDIAEVFGGMVPDEEGNIEDPDRIVRFAVGIAPTRNFRFFDSRYPYQEYSGSVKVSVRRVGAIIYGNYFGILGTTDKGADAFSQLIYGAQISLIIGVLATGLSTAVGVIVGMTAGYFGGKVDEALMRVVDFLLVIPGLPLMMVLAAFLGPSIGNIILVISILGWTGTSRLIRSQVLAEKNKAYVESARAIGASDTYIIFRHILPNVTPILFANITLGVVGAILSEAGLSFLGLTDPSVASWGRMLADARDSGGFSSGAWWVVVFPGMMITALSLAFTFVGHTLDQVLNPRLRER